ncbi:efflux RND transporter periplasmic adaptor subunit [Marinobacter salicampi]|uniref:efflux RND transporter periplasmic adaptor subunit n=1 Tax=Marinobacter salicampi TaxID=435907 RepID=UPI00140931B8|nr:HlyD family efflux transporter periplasmic adaptor subunit [Marinobacter salicampi]
MASSRFWLRSKRFVVPLVLIGLTVLLIWLFASLRPTPPEKVAEERAWPVRVTILEADELSPQLRLLGRVETPYSSTLTSSVTANVEAIPVLEGQEVSAGELIVALDETEVKLLLAQRQAEVDELLAQKETEKNQYQADQEFVEREQELVAITRRALEREQSLAESNLTSRSRTDQARQALQSAELSLISRRLAVANHNSRLQSLDARLQSARALVDQATMDLESTRVKAPFDGVVTSIQVSPGERVRAGEPLVALYATDRLEVRAQIPMRWVEDARQALAAGSSLSASVELLGKTHELNLHRLSGQVNAGAGGVDALFRFREQLPAITLNRTLDLRLDLAPKADTFSVPVSALYDSSTVYRITDGRLEPVEVSPVGDRFDQGSQRLLIQSEELTSGDRLLTTQLPNALRGLKVDVIEPEPGA